MGSAAGSETRINGVEIRHWTIGYGDLFTFHTRTTFGPFSFNLLCGGTRQYARILTGRRLVRANTKVRLCDSRAHTASRTDRPLSQKRTT